MIKSFALLFSFGRQKKRINIFIYSTQLQTKKQNDIQCCTKMVKCYGLAHTKMGPTWFKTHHIATGACVHL